MKIQISINNIPAKCKNSCDFEWLETSTPVVQRIDATNTKILIINGFGFSLSTVINFGNIPCKLISANYSQLICVPGLKNNIFIRNQYKTRKFLIKLTNFRKKNQWF